MPVRDLKPRVDLVSDNPSRFAARMTRGGRLGVLRLPFLEDAWGGIEAGQPELVLEALLSLLDNAIVVYLAYRDVEVAAGSTPEAVSERLRRVTHFAEFELGVMGAVPSWSGQVSEEEYLCYRYDNVYPAILLAEAVGGLELFPVPATYVELAHEARDRGIVALRRLSG